MAAHGGRPRLKYTGGSASWSAPGSFSPSPVKLQRCDSPDKAVPISPTSSSQASSEDSPRNWSRPSATGALTHYLRCCLPVGRGQQPYTRVSSSETPGTMRTSADENQDPWQSQPYGQPPPVPEVTTRQVCCYRCEIPLQSGPSRKI